MNLATEIGGSVYAAVCYVAPFLFVLAIVVLVHEFGHFIVGRWCGAAVKEFSLGFGPELFGLTDRRGTRWRVALIPLGGFVRFAAPAATIDGRPPEAPAHGTTLDKQSLMHRAAIVVAGPLANFLFAIVVFTFTVSWLGEYRLAPRIQRIEPNSVAERAGLQAGDYVLRADGESIESFQQFADIIGSHAGETIAIDVERDRQIVNLTATPRRQWTRTFLGRQRRGVLGIYGSTDPSDFRVLHPGPLQALQIGVARTGDIIANTGHLIGRLLTGQEKGDQLSGPIGIAQISKSIAPAGIFALLNLAGLISVSLGLFNLAPVPIFDGGHLTSFAIEGLRGRPLSRRTQEIGVKASFAVLGAMTVYVTINDICRIIVS